MKEKCSGSTFSDSEHVSLCYKDSLFISWHSKTPILVLIMLPHILVIHGIEDRIKLRGVCHDSEEL